MLPKGLLSHLPLPTQQQRQTKTSRNQLNNGEKKLKNIFKKKDQRCSTRKGRGSKKKGKAWKCKAEGVTLDLSSHLHHLTAFGLSCSDSTPYRNASPTYVLFFYYINSIRSTSQKKLRERERGNRTIYPGGAAVLDKLCSGKAALFRVEKTYGRDLSGFFTRFLLQTSVKSISCL